MDELNFRPESLKARIRGDGLIEILWSDIEGYVVMTCQQLEEMTERIRNALTTTSSRGSGYVRSWSMLLKLEAIFKKGRQD
jgi:hypothetical protein